MDLFFGFVILFKYMKIKAPGLSMLHHSVMIECDNNPRLFDFFLDLKMGNLLNLTMEITGTQPVMEMRCTVEEDRGRGLQGEEHLNPTTIGKVVLVKMLRVFLFFNAISFSFIFCFLCSVSLPDQTCGF